MTVASVGDLVKTYFLEPADVPALPYLRYRAKHVVPDAITEQHASSLSNLVPWKEMRTNVEGMIIINLFTATSNLNGVLRQGSR